MVFISAKAEQLNTLSNRYSELDSEINKLLSKVGKLSQERFIISEAIRVLSLEGRLYEKY